MIEVLATLVLLGIVLPVAMRGISLALAAATHARHMTEATGLAEQKIAELTSGDLATAGASAGDFGAEHPRYRWTSQTLARDYGLTQVDVQVSWSERARERSLIVSTLYNPNALTSSSTSTSGTSTTPGAAP